MLLILIENHRYLPFIENICKLSLTKYISSTKYGKLEIWTDKKKGITFVVNLKQYYIFDYNEIPLAIYDIILKNNVKYLGLLCKVGGINSLLNIGDILTISDYIDMTLYNKHCCDIKRVELLTNLNMCTPFCTEWNQNAFKLLQEFRTKYNSNIFSKGVYLCTQGPFFESTAEINVYKSMHADIVGHSLCPYVYLAKELSLSYSVITIVSNSCYDCNIEFMNNDYNNYKIAQFADIMIRSCPINN
jgi:5'-methylthioadenosine phosphorylase